MRPEDFARLEALQAELNKTFGVPAEPDSAIQRVMLAAAALGPLQLVARDRELTTLTADWLTPMVVDTLDRTVEILGELYDVLESEADDVQVMEPGTMVNQQFQDMPIQGRPIGAAAPGIGPQGVPRGELIR